MKNIMLISPNSIKALGAAALNLDENVMGEAIRTAQNVYLVDVVGTTLVETLQDKIDDGTIGNEDNIAYKTLLDEYIKYVLAYKVLEECAMSVSLKVRNIGVAKNDDTNTHQATLPEVRHLIDRYRTNYNHYLNRMADYLCEQKAAIPESNFDCGCRPTKKFANVNLFLN